MGFAVGTIETVPLIEAATTTGANSPLPGWAGTKTYQANGTTTAGAGTATILVQGSNDRTNWDTIGTLSLTLATATSSDSFASSDRYAYVRGNVSALTGTGASVNLNMGF